ncbi:MAG: phospholipase D-like domain-containing protein [Spirochaetaceae bacterium]|jgi:superfamily II DNA/RNA helicase/DNA replication protein DnaC|nr:phospholipase D-like domain-containing protein [Spirochaetaceae bacterium]
MPTIYDNKAKFLSKGLNEALAGSVRADFCVGYFNLRGWKALSDAADNLSGTIIDENGENVERKCRLLVGMNETSGDELRKLYSIGGEVHLDNATANRLKKDALAHFISQLGIGCPDDADEKTLRTLRRQLKQGIVCVKLSLYRLHAKLYLAYHDERSHLKLEGYVGSSNLTLAGLKTQGELNVDVLEQDAAEKLALWFDERWNDRYCLDITKELIAIIENSWAREETLLPYYAYLKMAYHLSREARSGMNEFHVSSEFHKELLDFQEKAVQIAAGHLNRRGGVVIGDVVGLGKTITATALAKIFDEDYGWSILIISPVNLVKMWQGYVDRYRLHAKVMPVSMVQKELSNTIRYKLVIIDESQNLRNSEGVHWIAIHKYISDNESKVVLLTATPYNKSYVDLSSQLRLFINDDTDLGISPECYIKALAGNSSNGVAHFAATHPDTNIHGIRAFEKSNWPEDWQELMRLFMVRRTRSFIKANYAKDDAESGRKYLLFRDGTKSYFPTRLAKKVEYKFDPFDQTDIYAKLYSSPVVEKIGSLSLPRYGLQNYLLPEDKRPTNITDEETTVFKNMSRAGNRLIGFCRTNLFKRLESSGYSFLLSIKRHILRNQVFIYALENGLPLPIGKNNAINLDEYLEDEDIEEIIREPRQPREQFDLSAEKIYSLYDSDSFHKRFDWVRSEYFSDELLKTLKKDSAMLQEVLTLGNDWNGDDDRQLNALADLLQKHKDEKVLVFTQFSDTAHYIYDELKKRNVQDIEEVSGSDENPTLKAWCFSPVSNKEAIAESADKAKIHKIRVLISTDVLSEGQNLQDCHIVINYDLPWAIIRLIQRAGRVDRIGQESPEIICYSFLPEDGLENIINLRGRLTRRIKENAQVVGSDETFFDGDPVNLADLYNEKSGIMDEDEGDSDVDLASEAYQIWKNAIDKNPRLERIIRDLPNNVYTTRELTANHANHANSNEGVIVYAHTKDDTDMLTQLDLDGNIVTQSQALILKTAACEPNEPSVERHETHHTLVRKAVENIIADSKNLSGTLGKRTGIKYQVYSRLERYYEEAKGTIFDTDSLKLTIDDIFKYRMRERAKDILNRELKVKASDAQLAETAIALRDEGKLVIYDDSENDDNEPEIICSMGLRMGAKHAAQ